MRAGLLVEWKQESGWKETNSGKKVQFGERQGERLLNEIGERGGLSEVGWFLCQKVVHLVVPLLGIWFCCSHAFPRTRNPSIQLIGLPIFPGYFGCLQFSPSAHS